LKGLGFREQYDDDDDDVKEHYLLWRNSRTLQAFLNATGNTQPIDSRISHVVSITSDCPSQILCKDWSSSF
jgi:hypothetical protein